MLERRVGDHAEEVGAIYFVRGLEMSIAVATVLLGGLRLLKLVAMTVNKERKAVVV